MYIVIELQKDNGQLANIVNSYDTLEQAESKYHQILTFAAVTTLEKHAAAILNDDGFSVRHESYPRMNLNE